MAWLQEKGLEWVKVEAGPGEPTNSVRADRDAHPFALFLLQGISSFGTQGRLTTTARQSGRTQDWQSMCV